VVDNLALSLGSTSTRTGIHTPLLDTGHGQRTLRAEETLRSTVGRTSEVSLETGADWAGSLGSALAVGTTGVRVTRVNRYRWRHRGWWYEDALGERISSVSLLAGTGWDVVNNLTSSLDPAGPRAGVDT
jgi:hypothetical protein